MPMPPPSGQRSPARSRRSSSAPVTWSRRWRSPSRLPCWSATATTPSPPPSAPLASPATGARHSAPSPPASTTPASSTATARPPEQFPPLRQQPAEPLDHPPWFALEAPPGDAVHHDPSKEEVLLTEPIALEGSVAAVGLVDVEFDREALRLPVGVELQADDVAVHRRQR